MSRRSRSVLKYILPPPFIKAVVAIILGAIVITLILYVSGGADLILGQVFRPSGLRPTECASTDRACIQQLQARTRVLNLCNRGDRDCAFIQLNAFEHATNFCRGNIECIRKQVDIIAGPGASPRPTALPQPRPNQRSVAPGNPLIINVQGRYERTATNEIYPKAVLFCQSPATAGLRNYLQSKLSALFGSRVSTGEWRSVAIQPRPQFSFPSPSSRLFTPQRFSSFFRATPSPTTVATPATPAPELYCSPPLCRPDQTLICPTTARHGCGCYCGTAATPAYTPPVPFGSRAPDGCWYFPPNQALRGQVTVPADALSGQATIKILEGQLQSNQAGTPAVERTFTVETVFVQGGTGARSSPTPAPLRGSSITVKRGGSFEKMAVEMRRSNPACTDPRVVRAVICPGYSVANRCDQVSVSGSSASTARFTLPADYPDGLNANVVGYNEAGVICSNTRVNIPRGSYPVPR